MFQGKKLSALSIASLTSEQEEEQEEGKEEEEGVETRPHPGRGYRDDVGVGDGKGTRILGGRGRRRGRRGEEGCRTGESESVCFDLHEGWREGVDLNEAAIYQQSPRATPATQATTFATGTGAEGMEGASSPTHSSPTSRRRDERLEHDAEERPSSPLKSPSSSGLSVSRPVRIVYAVEGRAEVGFSGLK